jgi:hypothetical protein
MKLNMKSFYKNASVIFGCLLALLVAVACESKRTANGGSEEITKVVKTAVPTLAPTAPMEGKGVGSRETVVTSGDVCSLFKD